MFLPTKPNEVYALAEKIDNYPTQQEFVDFCANLEHNCDSIFEWLVEANVDIEGLFEMLELNYENDCSDYDTFTKWFETTVEPLL